MNPKISVIIPFFNSETTLEKAVNSVITDFFSDWELILVNDGSTDSSERVAQSFLKDERISYLYQENKGVTTARNWGARKAKGDWLIFLDSDDWMEPDGTSTFSQILSEDSSLDLVFSWSVIHDLKTGKTEDWKSFHQMVIVGKSISYSNLAGTFLIKKEVFDRVGGYNPSLRFSENLDLIIRVLSLGELNIFYLKKVTVNFGNSLDLFIRNGKFSQAELLKSLMKFFESNPSLFEENREFAIRIISRIVVASIFLGKKDTSLEYIQKLKELESPRFSKFLWLNRISPVYRLYLSHRGFRV